MMRTISSLFILGACAAWGQSGAALPAFDVAAVKVNTIPMPANDMHEIDKIATSPTSLTMTRIRLKSAIKWAWSLSSYQVNGPGWIDSERYDIFAKTGSPVGEDQLRLMLRALIQERFKLTFHKDTKVMPAYELVVAKGGPKFKQADGDGDASFEPQPGRGMNVAVKKLSMGQFADLASGPLGAPVLDKTGLQGRFDFGLNLTPYMTGDRMGMEDLPGILSQALQEQLGLKLETRKDPLEVMVIEKVEKIPAEN
jgi:uncharacterized protein (TIGR03435 family)